MGVLQKILLILGFAGTCDLISLADGSAKQPPLVPMSDTSMEMVSGEIGHEIKLRCPVTGEEVMYRWWKEEDREIEIDNSWVWYRKIKRSLVIKRLSEKTVGTYKCRGTNGYGSAEYIFHVVIAGTEANIPALDTGHQRLSSLMTGIMGNQSLQPGEDLELSCRSHYPSVRSKVIWLKRPVANSNSFEQRKVNSKRSKIFQLGNKDFEMINKQEDRITITDGYTIDRSSYVHRLIVEDVNENDEGDYVCLVVGPDLRPIEYPEEGKNYKLATIRISSHTKESTNNDDDKSKSRNVLLTLLAVLTPVIFFLCSVLLVLLWKTRKLHSKTNQTNVININEEMVSIQSSDVKSQPQLKNAPNMEPLLQRVGPGQNATNSPTDSLCSDKCCTFCAAGQKRSKGGPDAVILKADDQPPRDDVRGRPQASLQRRQSPLGASSSYEAGSRDRVRIEI